MTTLEQLQQRYLANYIHLETLLKDHFTNIKSEEHFIKQVRSGKIAIKLSKLGPSNKAPFIVYLSDLADYLNEQELLTKHQ